MEEISKKDLLILTGISYGQLYRWKRKGLIPEEWFIKKASFTGQETYFPKDLILERIDRILELKDDVLLEDLSEIINKTNKEKVVNKEYIINKKVLFNEAVLEIDMKAEYTLEDVILLKIIDNVYAKVNQRSIYEFYTFLKKNTGKMNDYKTLFIACIDQTIHAFLIKDDYLQYNGNYYLKIDLKNLIENIKLILFV